MTARRKQDTAKGVEMAITPMLDMTFQLLFFFILNYHPSAIEGQMALSLPVDSDTKADKQENVTMANQDEELKLPADITVQVRTAKDETNVGLISQITVRDRAGETAVNDVAALQKQLESSKEGATNKEEVTIQPESKLKWSEVMKIMDACTKAGFKVGFGAPTDRGVGGGS
jgi:biopolymer transport protein ExbD